MKALRDYQIENFNTVFEALEKGEKRQLGVMATGLGKTLLGSHIINKFLEKPNSKALWITHTEDLIDQSAKALLKEVMNVEDSLDNHNTILEFLDDHNGNTIFADKNQTKIIETIGIIKQHRFDLHAKIQVASVQTIHRRLEKIDPKLYSIIIVDEAHLAMAETWQKCLSYFKPTLLLGLTATPERTDGLSLANLFDKITFQNDIKFGIDNGYLVELDALRVKTSIDIDSIKTTGGDLNIAQAEKLLNTPKRNQLIVDTWKENASNRSTIVFCVDVKHCKDLCETFNENGVKATFVVADKKECPDRTQRLIDFSNGVYQVMLNVTILTAGYDNPKVSCILSARPTKSKTLYIQMVGRGTRPVIDKSYFALESTNDRINYIKQSKKQDCLIIDIVDSTRRHQLVNTYTLEQEVPLEDRIYMTKEKRNNLLEKKAREIKLKHEQLLNERVKLIELPKQQVIKSTSFNSREASQAQLKWLEGEGFNTKEVFYSIRDASEIISNLPATEKQIFRLKKEGYNITPGMKVTRQQAEMAFRQIEEKTISDQLIKSPFKF